MSDGDVIYKDKASKFLSVTLIGLVVSKNNIW